MLNLQYYSQAFKNKEPKTAPNFCESAPLTGPSERQKKLYHHYSEASKRSSRPLTGQIRAALVHELLFKNYGFFA